MAKTLGGKFVRFLTVLISAVLLVSGVFMFTACSSKDSEISVRISFNDKEYTLNYKLYRNYYRQTVEHFTALVEADFFDNSVIHDYRDGERMIGGGYKYESDMADVAEDLKALDYDGTTVAEDGSIKTIQPSVWKDAEHKTATNRLYGETVSNGHKVENNSGLSNRFGSLGMYSYVPEKVGKTPVYWNRTLSGKEGGSEYFRNSFTSMFYIFTGTSAASENTCVFGELADEKSKTALTDLVAAIKKYEEDSKLDSFTKTKTMNIKDEFTEGGSYEVTYGIPQGKIVIEEVKVTKY